MLVAVVATACSNQDVAQPIPFNHKLHTAEADCDQCHVHALNAQHATLPSANLCMDCHDSDITSNSDAAKYIALIRQYAAARTLIPWVRLLQLPHHVYFSHRRHTTIAGLACQTCHGDMEQRESPPSRPVGRKLDMDDCMDCHDEHGIGHDCTLCHR